MLEMSAKTKRQSISIEKKISIINEISAGSSQAQICQARNLPKQTANTIWQSREKIQRIFEEAAMNDK